MISFIVQVNLLILSSFMLIDFVFVCFEESKRNMRFRVPKAVNEALVRLVET